MALEAASYMQPIIRQINGRLGILHTSLERERVTFNSSQRGLTHALEHLHAYDASSIKVVAIFQGIGHFDSSDLGNTSYLFQRFIKDLQYVEFLEQGGLEVVNARVQYLFDQFKQAKDVPSQESFASQLNDLFYRTIYLFPHLAHSIEIKLIPNFADKDYLEKNIWPTFEDTNRSTNFSRISSDGVVSLPLPFSFSTGTHGSGERSAFSASERTILFGSSYNRKIQQHKPVIQIGLSRGLSTILSTFSLDEIKGLKFSEQERYTPRIHRSDRDAIPEQQPGPVWFYLYFRNFKFKFLSSGISENRDWNFLATKTYDNLSQLGFFVKLNPQGIPRNLEELGLLGSDEIQLLQFDPTALQKYEKYEKVGLLKYLRESSPARVFVGHKIIEELTGIPVEERHF